MVTILRFSDVRYDDYDEVWAIVRSLKYANTRVRHVPELSPSWALFNRYRRLKEDGQWNEETFRKVYVPQFLKEMKNEKAQEFINMLVSTKKNIALVCFCTEEELCHRSIIGGILQGAGANVRGLFRDYSFYYDWYMNSIPDTPKEEKIPIRDINPCTVNLWEMPDRALFDTKMPTLCATGRRPKDLCGYDTRKYQGFVMELAETLYKEFYLGKGVKRFISGGAQGFDQMFFWAVERMKSIHKLDDIFNILFIPFEGQDGRWGEKGLFSRAEYRMMLKKASGIVVVSDENNISALFARNHAMCDYSDYCLGLYPDDTWVENKGGTSECLRYAVKHCTTYRIGYTTDRTGLHMGDTVMIRAAVS